MALKSGTANLPLHWGKAPKWLFKRMVKLAGEISEVIVLEYGKDEFLKRLADPFWFQAFGCVLGFDWHSSGLTTTVTGALKEGLKGKDLGLVVCGGKGSMSRRTPHEIENKAMDLCLSTKSTEGLVYSSRMSAKVDNTALQDGYQLYHHVFIFTEKGKWTVIQQGLNTGKRYARRYHWISGLESFVDEPHSGISGDRKEKEVLDMTSSNSKEARKQSVDMVNDNPKKLARLFSGQSNILDFTSKQKLLNMPRSHYIINMHKKNMETLQKAYELQPKNYEELLCVPGLGPKTVRALALVSDLVYGKPPSWKDPVKFSFSHGGKDGIPYPVDRETYDRSIGILRDGVKQARLGSTEKLRAIKRLNGLYSVS